MSTRGPRQPGEPAGSSGRLRSDNALLAIDALIVLVGLGIVVRGLVQIGSVYYIALGVVFAMYGLWRLRQRLRARRQSG
ncbi:MAG TPA: hypothetical protein VFE42_28460 [Chloroflexota bacterium]|nr:hypothetical protein [Chloroflexota bacterium]